MDTEIDRYRDRYILFFICMYIYIYLLIYLFNYVLMCIYIYIVVYMPIHVCTEYKHLKMNAVLSRHEAGAFGFQTFHQNTKGRSSFLKHPQYLQKHPHI